MRLFAFAVCLTVFAAPVAAEEPDGPSFDCAKAASRAEKAICESPFLGWHDRQLARAYREALKLAGATGADAVKAGQKAFLKTRDACKDDDCIERAYIARLEDLAAGSGDAAFTAAGYAEENGTVIAVTYPDGSAALSIFTIGGNDHTCGFQVSDAAQEAGAIVWNKNPDASIYQESCRVTATPRGADISVLAEGESCTYFCGMRASLDGQFTRIAR